MAQAVIAGRRLDGVDVWVAPLDGGPAALIVPASTDPSGSYDSPLWSPDGKRIAFGVYLGHPETGESERVAIDVVNADGSGHHRLTKRRGLLEDGFAWSPDSKYLAYPGLGDGAITAPSQDTVLGELPRDLYLIAIDGTVSGNSPIRRPPSTTPDGRRMAPSWGSRHRWRGQRIG